MNQRFNAEKYREGILKRDRVMLAKAITLVESSLPSDQQIASDLINYLLPYTGNSVRIGITGVPGVGKSTFIEAFGKHVIAQGKRVAILTIDPSSQVTRGSILGDKTRMEELVRDRNAFIRPSSSGEKLGGVANNTRESILLCEAAGFDIIIVETVGVGQSETSVKNMVDFFLLLMLAGAGDELQGIKKGIVEMADALVITKADGDNERKASEAMAEYQQALHFGMQKSSDWSTKVLKCSALTNQGIDSVWQTILNYTEKTKTSGYFSTNREQQNIAWMADQFQFLLSNDFKKFETIQKLNTSLKEQVARLKLSPATAAIKLLNAYHEAIKSLK
ncbi:methylmalonyl Co-A mutase-associated GTPase MeaB [Fulvivirgaceae bacterium PWU20]|uniref:Methylmalonyl Co-A mutase-associated GTPase MeaB n=1 Tax=Chryseosolibacter indicus TaxID=2782351 RepID=A0ABS5VV49_9BACT|nr:methylmalonyl Co-A mutase-associated GTPase MeaB [Chryseosolibacter indicus]